MEDQGKRLMLAVVIAFGIMMAWTVLFPPDKPEERPEEDTKAEVAKENPSSPPRRDREGPAIDADAPPSVDAVEAPVVARGDEVFFDFEYENILVRFSSYGAALTSWQLLSPRMRDRKKKQPEDLVRLADAQHPNMRVWFADSTYNIPADAEWKGEKKSDTEMRFVWESADIRVVKAITIHPEEFMVTMDVTLDLVGAASAKQALAVTLYSMQAPADDEEAGMFTQVERRWQSACFEGDELKLKSAKSLAKKGEKRRTGDIRWGGFDHAYFLVAGSLKPFDDAQDQRTDCNAYAVDGVAGGMGVDLIQSSYDLKNGEPGLRAKVAFYFGPKYRDTLAQADKVAGMKTNFEEAVDLGFLGVIAGPLLSLLNLFQGFVVNWGLAILLLTFVVKAVTLPWTHKSMKSMKAMSKLKPQLEKIKEKYKDDRAKQNTETMALFKSHKVNPMSGCLPMLLQMPIWFALYRSLTVAGELYQAPFIAGWIDDLTLPDPYHVMPVLLTGMMFLQTKLTPTTGTGAQQKMLMYGMPIMFGVFSFFFPAGLTLYIFTNTCFTALHHLYMHKEDRVAAGVKVAASAIGDVIDVESSEAPSEDADKGADKDADSSSESSARSAKNNSGGQSSKKRSNKSGKKKRKS